MAWRFYRRVHFPGGSMNFSTGGTSLSIGGRGAHITFGRRGITRTVGIPARAFSGPIGVHATPACITASALTAGRCAAITSWPWSWSRPRFGWRSATEQIETKEQRSKP